MQSTLNNTSYNHKEMASFLGIESSIMQNIYSLYASINQETTLSVSEFINFILAHQNDSALANNLSKNTLNELKLLQKIVDGILKNSTYSAKHLANLLGIDQSNIALIYSLYDVNYQNKNISVSLKEFIDILENDIMNNNKYADSFDQKTKLKIKTINQIMTGSITNNKYNNHDLYELLQPLTNNLDKNLIDLLYIYYGSQNHYDNSWHLTVEKFVTFLNSDLLNNELFQNFLDSTMKSNIKEAQKTIIDAKEMLIGPNYSRLILNTKFDMESQETFKFLKKLKDDLKENTNEFYIIGNSPMAYEMSQTFSQELNYITILTMIFIFIVVAFTFKSLLISSILVILIQCAVYLIMGILSFGGGTVYFISLLIVQSILMGATIDYAILYTSYYLESRKKMNIKEAIINSYNKSIHTILTSASILIIVTLIVGNFASAIAAKICKTLSEGTLCSTLLILLLLPAVLAACDRIIIKKSQK